MEDERGPLMGVSAVGDAAGHLQSILIDLIDKVSVQKEEDLKRPRVHATFTALNWKVHPDW